MKKIKFFINIEKEESWIESYTLRGYQLIKVVGNCYYQFEKQEAFSPAPKVKLDFRCFNRANDFINYLSLFEDSGWKHISGSKSSGVQYFEQMNFSSDENIFSDDESKAARYKRMSQMWLGLFYAYLPILVAFNLTGIFDFRKLVHWKELYYTPGLWEKTGGEFWRAFLFETPFAFERGVLGFLILAICLLYAYFGIKALYLYHTEKKEYE